MMPLADEPLSSSSIDTDATLSTLMMEPAFSAQELMEPRYVHPDSQRLYKACGGTFSWTRYVPIFGPAIEAFGPKFVITLDFTSFMSKGLANYLMQNSYLPMFTRRFKCTAMEYQRYNNVTWMGWSMKPLTALISDSFAVFGYTKRWYMVVSAILTAITCCIYASLPPVRSSGAVAAAMCFLSLYGMANLDILAEGLYSRVMRILPGCGPILVSSLWWMLHASGVIAALVVGPLSSKGQEAVGAYVAGACMLVVIPIYALNGFDELTNREERVRDRLADDAAAQQEEQQHNSTNKVPRIERTAVDGEVMQEDQGEEVGDVPRLRDAPSPGNMKTALTRQEAEEEVEGSISSFCGGAIEYNRGLIQRDWPAAIYAITMTVGALAAAVVTIHGGTWPILVTCCVTSSVLCFMAFWSLPLLVAKASLYAFLSKMTYVQINAPLQTFYTATAEQYPPGPHFSFFFYITTSSLIGHLASLIGIAIFVCIFSKRSYRLAFIVTTLLQTLGSVVDLILVKRWNKDIGIPDHWAYICGDAIVFQITYALSWMPMTVMLCQLCPRGSESLVYSLVAGLSNFGGNMAGEIGTLLMDFVWPVDTGVIPYDFSNLPWLIIVGHLILPLASIPLVFLLIPNAKISEKLDTENSPRLFGGGTKKEGCSSRRPSSSSLTSPKTKKMSNSHSHSHSSIQGMGKAKENSTAPLGEEEREGSVHREEENDSDAPTNNTSAPLF